MNKRRALGMLGERKAARFLKKHGLKILQRNWRCTLGELDLIALDRDTVVFVEVRTSSRGFAGGPTFTVGPHKVRKLRNLGRAWLRRHPGVGNATRFDVIGVTRHSWRRFDIDWVKNAFVA